MIQFSDKKIVYKTANSFILILIVHPQYLIVLLTNYFYKNRPKFKKKKNNINYIFNAVTLYVLYKKK